MIYGTAILVLGIIIRLIAIRQLKRSFSFQLRMPARIMKKGIYKYVRHPSYIGSILIIAGLSLLYLPLAVTYLAFAFFLSRAINEEQILKQDGSYLNYIKKTGMFLPKLRRK